MKATNPWRLLPHELLFGVFMLITWARLATRCGAADVDALVYLAFIAGNVALISISARRGTPLSWRLRLLFYPLAMNVLFFGMKAAVPKIHPAKLDGALQQIDTWSLGTTPSVSLQALIHPALTECLSLCYLLFFPYLLFSMIYYFVGELPLLKKFFAGLFSIYGLGFLGYSLVPAAGPYLAMADRFTVPLDGWWLTRLNDAIVRAGSNGVDVFPSLHCAVSSYILFFDRRHRPWRFKLYLLPCVGLWISTLYLRYHYAIDLVCGFGLSALALWLAKHTGNSHELHPHLPGRRGDADRT